MSKITIYGADWCHDTQRTRRQLDGLGIPYNYIDIDEDPDAEQWITDQHNGKRVTPTVELDGMLLFEPSNQEMEQALRESGIVT